MTQRQAYIILIVLSTCLAIFFIKDTKTDDLPNSIGDPLELILIKSPSLSSDLFYKTLTQNLTVDIGPSPQEENFLSITQLETKNFTGIFKRHQNLLFIQESSKFNLSIKYDVFAKNQLAIILECSSYEDLNNHRTEILSIINIIQKTEISRLVKNFKSNLDKSLGKKITKTHDLLMFAPRGFFLAHSDTSVTWIRRETSKISQGVFIANLSPEDALIFKSPNNILTKIDSLIKPHISSQIEGSYMICDKNAPIKLDTFNSEKSETLKLQSLWKMENDFMGGIFQAYLYNSISLKNPILVYAYLYAPGEQKNIPLIQLEALVSTMF